MTKLLIIFIYFSFPMDGKNTIAVNTVSAKFVRNPNVSLLSALYQIEVLKINIQNFRYKISFYFHLN
jgi:hypothetical protein